MTNWSADNKQFSLVFEENPLADFVELPDDGKAQDELWFSNILCGVLRGALEMVCQAQLWHPSGVAPFHSNRILILCSVRSKCRLRLIL